MKTRKATFEHPDKNVAKECDRLTLCALVDNGYNKSTGTPPDAFSTQ